jgi:hypothetical protein
MSCKKKSIAFSKASFSCSPSPSTPTAAPTPFIIHGGEKIGSTSKNTFCGKCGKQLNNHSSKMCL